MAKAGHCLRRDLQSPQGLEEAGEQWHPSTPTPNLLLEWQPVFEQREGAAPALSGSKSAWAKAARGKTQWTDSAVKENLGKNEQTRKKKGDDQKLEDFYILQTL